MITGDYRLLPIIAMAPMIKKYTFASLLNCSKKLFGKKFTKVYLLDTMTFGSYRNALFVLKPSISAAENISIGTVLGSLLGAGGLPPKIVENSVAVDTVLEARRLLVDRVAIFDCGGYAIKGCFIQERSEASEILLLSTRVYILNSHICL